MKSNKKKKIHIYIYIYIYIYIMLMHDNYIENAFQATSSVVLNIENLMFIQLSWRGKSAINVLTVWLDAHSIYLSWKL